MLVKIALDDLQADSEIIVPDFYGKSIRESARLANKAGLKIKMSGSVIKVNFSP